MGYICRDRHAASKVTLELAARLLRVVWGVWRTGRPRRAACRGRSAERPTGHPRLPRGVGTATPQRGGHCGGPPGDTGAPLPLSRAWTRPRGSLGQRGDRMVPLRWGARDRPGAVQVEEAR